MFPVLCLYHFCMYAIVGSSWQRRHFQRNAADTKKCGSLLQPNPFQYHHYRCCHCSCHHRYGSNPTPYPLRHLCTHPMCLQICFSFIVLSQKEEPSALVVCPSVHICEGGCACVHAFVRAHVCACACVPACVSEKTERELDC